jgi:hypothetical protein
MGVDLRLLPLIGQDAWASHDMLGLERRRELWPEIERLPQLEILKPVRCWLATGPEGDNCYGEVARDGYDNPLRFTLPRHLLTLAEHEAITDNWQNRAVWAYLAQMAPDWPIVLYWH